ncbi:hypothetical protein CVIRNUC_010538 [Coccomyxa viridis]|uniref:Uncharacterized protein n=1 Tax=Coccomyxa viridis TaxID=1274662 RepID=A0AAV1IM46_9CHLO|nr:hypothetical protein CVIRNUC_010538 [Coccomyxa viridis]
MYAAIPAPLERKSTWSWKLPFLKAPGSTRALQDEVIHHQRQEIEYMREHLHVQDEEMRALQRGTGISSHTAADLRERLNFQCFKYELLVDMWAMRVLDNEELAQRGSA